MEDAPPPFNVGHHDPERSTKITSELLSHSRNLGYSFLTIPITTAHFHSRVLAQLSQHISEDTAVGAQPPPIPPLEPVDTPLAPREDAANLVAFASTWTDLCSPDPLIANLSKQILSLEVAYAAFCGIGYVVLPTPILHHGDLYHDGLTQYARAVQEALNTSVYLSIIIVFPLIELPDGSEVSDMGSLAPFARDLDGEPFEASPNQPQRTDAMGSWDAWNVIRSFCNYSSRLFVSLKLSRTLPSEPVLKRWFAEPLRLLIYSAKTFQRNQAGFPVLQKAHQALLARYMKLRPSPWILLSSIGPLPAGDGSGSESPEKLAGLNALSPSSSYMAESVSGSVSRGKRPPDPTPHLSYMKHLERNQPSRTVIEQFGSGYQDYLQAPLQPLADNLESITYEVFEKDPIKYDWYEKAVYSALNDWTEFERAASGPEGRVTIAVVGAGRGPLVHRALRAADKAGVPIDMWAIEKNPNAYVVLKQRNEDQWDDRVNVIKSDMRSWRGPFRSARSATTPELSKEAVVSSPQQSHDQNSSTAPIVVPQRKGQTQGGYYGKVDILISELLGSFADNELSPECLDGISHVLAPQGISIPCSYTAHISPISAPKLHTEVISRTVSDPEAPFVPYVVMFNAIDFLSSQPLDPTIPIIQQTWKFSHPVSSDTLQTASLRKAGGSTGGAGGQTGGDGANEHNSRFSRLKFVCQHRGVINGLAGYFETVLYDGSAAGERNKGRSFEAIELSTNPLTMEGKSKDMISWFPIYFPLKVPLYIPDNSEVVINIWRQTDDRMVWYEWVVETFVILGKHNRRIRLGATDLHSSKKNGCLM